MNQELKIARRKRVKQKIRKRVIGTSERPRLTIFRSNTAIYAQIIDDGANKTIVSCSSSIKEISAEKGKKVDKSVAVGKMLATKARSAGVNSVVFDRNGYKYHGRIKALADAAREGGLIF